MKAKSTAIKLKFKPHQNVAVDYALKNDYSILALDPGLGKSAVAIKVADGKKAKTVVVCPSYLIPNWVKELNKWSDRKDSVYPIYNGKSIPQKADLGHYDYYITSYDLIQKGEQLMEWTNCLILDEAHAIKSMDAKRSQFIHRTVFENSIDKVMLLTGTPIKNRVKEFYSLMALTYYNPKCKSDFLEVFPDEITFADHFSFREEFTIRISDYREVPIVKWSGLKNKPELKEWLKDRYLRVRSKDVLDLPPISFKDWHISDTPDPTLLRAFNDYFGADDFGETKSIDEIDREDRVSSVLPEHKAAAALKKVPFTIKYAKNLIDEVGCCLIYSDHVESARAIAKEFKVEAITGHMSPKKRMELAKKFQDGEGEVLVATIGSMKEGVDLFRSQHIVLNDICWVPGDLTQVIYRIQRIGQTGKCLVHRMIGSPQDGHIIEAISSKAEVISQLT